MLATLLNLEIGSSLLFIKCWTRTNDIRKRCERQMERILNDILLVERKVSIDMLFW